MLSKKWKARFQISLQKPHIPGWRPAPSLLTDPYNYKLRFSRGYPIFETQSITGRQDQGSQRKFTIKAPRYVPKTDYDESNFHEVQGKFRFSLTGRFPSGGALFEAEVFKAADDLFLSGNLKCRANFVRGELQGDANALSYMQKWLEQGHNSLEAGRITSCSFSDHNFGVPPPTDRILRCVKDWRKHRIRVQQTEKSAAKMAAPLLYQRSLVEQHKTRKANEASKLTNY